MFENNAQCAYALDRMERTSANLFITGRAGTGKSTLLKYFRDTTKKKIVVLAPTGVAAVNVGGQTIHSFFGFTPETTPDTVKYPRGYDDVKDVYRALDTIVIDEVSMVRADLFDCIDIFLRKAGRDHRKPFGGVQMILVGDLYQLPPVVTTAEREVFFTHYTSPYFFSARVCGGSRQQSLLELPEYEIETIELDTVYRQIDHDFVSLLNAVRDTTVSELQLQELNQQCVGEDFDYASYDGVWVTTTNALASRVNHGRLAEIDAKEHVYTARVENRFDRSAFPTEESLCLKVGARVMILHNDPNGAWHNGSMGVVTSFVSDDDEGEYVMVELDTGDIVAVGRYTWDMRTFYFDKDTKHIESEVVGSFVQFPLKLAWAVTIHKSQGKTFDRVLLDIGRGSFAPGQVYVALSRCTSLSGLRLCRPINRSHIFMDPSVRTFFAK